MGLFPQSVESYDLICILYGSQVPFVLRPKNGHYQLIGECYVHGKMDGEVIQDIKYCRFHEEYFDIR
jgi:hypothetical protein